MGHHDGMSLEELAPDEVIALRFEDAAVAEELATWCDGGLMGETITVPTGIGVQPAHVGDWIVRDASGHFEVLSHDRFALKYGPAQG